MIAIATNVLLRYLLPDDAVPSPKATKLLTGQHNVLITDVVLVETIWTLKGRNWRLGKPDLLNVIATLFEEPNVLFEDSQIVWDALQDYRTVASGNTVDFADTLILEKAKSISLDEAQTFNGLYTVDTDLQQLGQTKTP